MSDYEIDSIAMDIAAGRLELWQLPRGLVQIVHFSLELGRRSRDAEVAQLERDADRYYYEMCQRPTAPQGEYISWADLQARRESLERQAAGSYPGGDLLAAWGMTA